MVDASPQKTQNSDFSMDHRQPRSWQECYYDFEPMNEMVDFRYFLTALNLATSFLSWLEVGMPKEMIYLDREL